MRTLLIAALTSSLAFFCSSAGAEIHLAQGSMSGEVTDSSVLLQTRLTATEGLDEHDDVPGADGVVRFQYGRSDNFVDAAQTEWLTAAAERDYIVRAQLTGLQPNTLYYYRAVYGADRQHVKHGDTCSFKTLPGGQSDAAVSFVMGSCMNYNKFLYGKEGRASGPVTATDEDKRLGYPAFVAIDALDPDFFIGTGDIVYYDNVINNAQNLPELRQCWHEQFRFSRLVTFFQQTPAYWSKDDHDFRFNESDGSGERLPLPQTGIELFREQMPILPADNRQSPTYRTHRVNRDLQLWLTEGRDYRSPNPMEDGPQKTLWGEQQRAWLQETLKASDAQWKIIISPTPMVGPDDGHKMDNHTNLGGFRHEANAFFDWLRENQIELMTFCGDRHWQFHSIHPSGVEEFACGALNDENARRGVAPGSKQGTDPEALIQQPYTYDEPTGGFLHVTCTPGGEGRSRLVIEFRDDTGKVLHTVSKQR